MMMAVVVLIVLFVPGGGLTGCGFCSHEVEIEFRCGGFLEFLGAHESVPF